MSVHYKFKSALEYDTVTFDGLHISVKDLKNAIIQQKRIGKNTDFDLQVTNAQTKEVYTDENTLIPKNTSLLIARIPNAVQNKSKNWEGYGGDSTPPAKLDEGGPIAKAADLSSLDAPEDDKIKAMMSQSTQDYDPSNYLKIRGANQMGAVPPNYRCYKCHQTGHWIKDCPLGQGPEPIEIKKSTGIPRSFMVPVEGPQVQGAMMTPNGSYAVPVLDHQTYTQKQAPPAPIQEQKLEIPEDLLCSICSDLLSDAVMIPCCGNSFCDECIRSCLLDSEDHECPDCHEKDISPGTLIPNRFLRTSVANFKNTTGYIKKPIYRQPIKTTEVIEPKNEVAPVGDRSGTPEVVKEEAEEKTVISEADSTEQAKVEDPIEDKVEEKEGVESYSESLPEGPPGVSPRESPVLQKTHDIKNRVTVRDRDRDRNSKHRRDRDRDRDRMDTSPRRGHRHSPGYEHQEERPGTPTVDEPGLGNYAPPVERMYNPPTAMPPMMNIGPPPIQGHPPSMSGYSNAQPLPTYPSTQGPPPNFRLPPPGSAPPPFLQPGPYPVPQRSMYDNRPPITGPPPGYGSGYHQPASRGHRDYSSRRMRDRTPPGVIDDPLAAFNKMLREKDERERRAKMRNRRSYSRSHSRSRSYSRSPRRRSRSPRRRQSRSRSRSFSGGRSRSRTYSGGSLRGSPYRQMSPSRRSSPPSIACLPPRRGHSRYRSPPRHRHHQDRRERDHDEYLRDERSYREKERDRDRDRERHRERDKGRDDRDRDRDRYYDGFDERRVSSRQQWSQPPMQQPRGPPEGFYPDMQHGYSNTRYPGRDYPPYVNKTEPPPHIPPIVPMQHLPPMRRFDDIAPPGVEEPPVPGLEPLPRLEERFDRGIEDVDRKSKSSHKEREENRRGEKKEEKHERRKRHEKRSRSPEGKIKSPRRKSKEAESPEKHKKKKYEDSSDREEKKKDYSDDEKYKKSKDKKKRKERRDSEKKKKKDKKEKHKKEEKEKDKKQKEDSKTEVKTDDEKKASEEIPCPKSPEKGENDKSGELYNDEGIDSNMGESFEKIEEFINPEPEDVTGNEPVEDSTVPKELDETERDILDLHSNDLDLKLELDKSEVLAPLPEKSKWEFEEDASSQSSPKDPNKLDMKDKSGKVTNEVLKRAENAIFAKAINAIRPIEIKKLSSDRAKLYSGERETEKTDKTQLVVPVAVEHKKTEPAPTTRVSVKDRLGVKVDDNDRVVKLDRNRSRSLSPFSRRGDGGRNFGINERRVELDERKRHEQMNKRSRSKQPESRDRERRMGSKEHRDMRDSRDLRRDHRDLRREDPRKFGTGEKRDQPRKEDRRGDSRSRTREDDKKDKRKRSRSRSASEDRNKHKKRDKKIKKEKPKKHHNDDKTGKEEKFDIKEVVKPKLSTDKRKPTLDEASFEPDYDLESESDKDEARDAKKAIVEKSEDKDESSSSDSSSSSSEDDRKKKKHKKHKKRKKRDSSSSSSDSESESSDEEKDKKRKKHKKKSKKRKKSKHK